MNQMALPKNKVRRKPIFRTLPDGLWGYIFISPWLLGFFILTLWPMIQSFYLSFTYYDLLSSPEWIGVANFKEIFTDDSDFKMSVWVTTLYVFIGTPLKVSFALLVALILKNATKGMVFFRGVYYLPSLIGGSIAISIIWRNIFGSEGIFNSMLGAIGIQGIDWINTPETALYTLILLTVWQFGSSMVIFLAGLKQIPRDLYEAASVDGANRFRTFIAITLPMLTPIILFNVIMQFINSFQMFTQAFVITNGGPINSTLVYALYIYRKAFSQLDMGYASALAWIMLVVIAISTALIFSSSKKWVHYES